MAPRLPSHPLLREAVRPIAALVGTSVVGIVGFAVLAHIGPVEAVFWLVDPTSLALFFADHGGPETATKAFAIVVRLGLILSGLWIGESVLAEAYGGRVLEEVTRMQTERRIAGLSDHVVVCGYGMFGRTVAATLEERGTPVVAVESDPTVYETIDGETLAIQGDSRRESVLEKANVGDAAAVIAAIDDSNANIQIAITVAQHAPDVEMVVRVGDEMYERVARHAGADVVVIPEVLSGQSVSEWL